MNEAEMHSLLLLRRILTEEAKTTLCPLFSISKAGESLTILIRYLVVDVFSVHIIVGVLLFLQKVFRGWNSVIIQQLASILSHLVRLAFTSLFEAFYMTVIRFRQRIIFKAVPLHSTIFDTRFTNTPAALFASSRVVVCSQFQIADIKKHRNEKKIVCQRHSLTYNIKLSIAPGVCKIFS